MDQLVIHISYSFVTFSVLHRVPTEKFWIFCLDFPKSRKISLVLEVKSLGSWKVMENKDPG